MTRRFEKQYIVGVKPDLGTSDQLRGKPMVDQHGAEFGNERVGVAENGGIVAVYADNWGRK
jgi:hypothetical protein